MGVRGMGVRGTDIVPFTTYLLLSLLQRKKVSIDSNCGECFSMPIKIILK
jgi:hypothetical protein